MEKSKGKQKMDRYDTLEFKRGYIAALFEENERWITCIEKYWMVVPGIPTLRSHKQRDLEFKEKLADQVHPDTYQQRKAYYEAWSKAKGCADCDQLCDRCPKPKFKHLPTRLSKAFDTDVRRFMQKHHRFWLGSEQKKALKDIGGGVAHGDGREISDQADCNDVVWDGGRKGIRRSGKLEENSSNPYQRQKESFLWPGSGGVAFKESFEYWGQ